jgi:hypothetical protein
MALTPHGFDDVTGRELFSLQLASAAELPMRVDLPSKHFACFLAWDASRALTDSVSQLAERLLHSGASYIVCWGPDSERVEAIVDEITASTSAFGMPADSSIMTSSHSTEDLDEALWFFLTSSWPDEHYVDSTRAALAISIGSLQWAHEISAALADVRTFVQSISTDGVA